MKLKDRRAIMRSGWFAVYKDYAVDSLEERLAYLVENRPRHTERIRVISFLIVEKIKKGRATTLPITTNKTCEVKL